MPQHENFSHYPLASTGNVVQLRKLLYTRLSVDEPTVLFVQMGQKTLRWRGREMTVQSGEMVLLAAGQTFDVLNCPDAEQGVYQATWIALNQETVNEFADLFGVANYVQELQKIAPTHSFHTHFQQIKQLLEQGDEPELVVKLKLFTLLAWLKTVHLSFAPHEKHPVLRQIRKTIAANTALDWTAEQLAAQFHLSEASLRRVLQKSGTSFREVLTDVRMSRALTLLQITTWQVSRIAHEVGYDSASRFTVRFKQRFGFLPSDVRGQDMPVQNEQQKLINVGIKK